VEIPVAVERARTGEAVAFGELYEQLSQRVYNYLYYHLNGRTQLAEDLTEEVFVKVLEKLNLYQDRGLPFSAWIFRIAHNHLIDFLRAQPRPGVVSIDDCQDLRAPGAERTLELALTHAELTCAMAGLTADQHRVIVLRFLQGLGTSETAEVLGKTEDAVRRLQARGLRVLKKSLEISRRALVVA
jgi:RNA polymerase sigma-70 factor (ECF subfamily)